MFRVITILIFAFVSVFSSTAQEESFLIITPDAVPEFEKCSPLTAKQANSFFRSRFYTSEFGFDVRHDFEFSLPEGVAVSTYSINLQGEIESAQIKYGVDRGIFVRLPTGGVGQFFLNCDDLHSIAQHMTEKLLESDLVCTPIVSEDSVEFNDCVTRDYTCEHVETVRIESSYTVAVNRKAVFTMSGVAALAILGGSTLEAEEGFVYLYDSTCSSSYIINRSWMQEMRPIPQHKFNTQPQE